MNKDIIDFLHTLEYIIGSNCPITRGCDCVGFIPPTEKDLKIAECIRQFADSIKDNRED